MTGAQRALLLDTNIWLDYFDKTRTGFESAVALIVYAREMGIGLLIAPTSCKDFYYQCSKAVKDDVRTKGGEVTQDAAAAAEEFAWGCLQNILDIATVVSMGGVDAEMSRSTRRFPRRMPGRRSSCCRE